jgi:pimeloyl-ACP methyl ester carboxylesterase
MRDARGMNRTTLVLLPGLDGTEIFFAPLLASLPDWIDPVVVTYPAGGPNGYEDLAPIVDRAVDGLGRFAILGWSFGGPLALGVAAKRPSQVSHVVLCSSFVKPPRPGLVAWRFAAIGPVIGAVRALRRLRLLVPGWATTEFRKAKAKTWRRVKSGVLASRVQAVLGVDASRLLEDCRASILYLAATRDEVVSRGSIDEVLALAPGTRVEEIEGPHFALFTNPSRSAQCIAGFLSAGSVRKCEGSPAV